MVHFALINFEKGPLLPLDIDIAVQGKGFCALENLSHDCSSPFCLC